MQELRPGVSDYFYQRVNPGGGCWEWLGTIGVAGYGTASHRRGVWYAHRLSYQLHYGPIPNGLHVRHKCDNPPCVNPAHLELGTAADNARDKVERGRQSRGEIHGSAKLCEADVRAIRRAPQTKRVRQELSAQYGVSVEYISKLRAGHFWPGVE